MSQLFSYKNREAYELDVETALKLVTGVWQRGKNDKYSVQFCSANTKPTEQEARAALSRLLLVGELPDLLRLLLAILFTPNLFGDVKPSVGVPKNIVQRKVVFKKLSTGHSNPITDVIIAAMVQHLRDRGRRYEKAIKEVAKVNRLDERHVKRIYSKHKGRFLNQFVGAIRHSISSMNSSQFWEFPLLGWGGISSMNSDHGVSSSS
jgi:hypothetical protein